MRVPAQIRRFNSDQIALRQANATLTYRDLNYRADLFAARLRHLGVRPADSVGISSSDRLSGSLPRWEFGGAALPTSLWTSPGPMRGCDMWRLTLESAISWGVLKHRSA